jgi:hypothetical protein
LRVKLCGDLGAAGWAVRVVEKEALIWRQRDTLRERAIC